MELDSLALDHLGLEGLDTEAVQCRGTVEQHGVPFHHVFEDVPYNRFLAVHDFLGALDGLHDAALYEAAYNEGLVELGGHEFGDTALVHLQLGANHDYGTCGVVHTFTEQVLAETSLLAFQRVGKGLEGTVDVALDRRRFAGVVEQGVDGLLEKTLLVAEDDLRSLYFDESFKTVVADDDTTVEVVDVGSGEASAVERHEGTEFGGNNRDGLENHPLRLVTVGRREERVDHLEAFQGLGLALLRAVAVGRHLEVGGKLGEVEFLEQVIDRLCAHLGDELVRVAVFQSVVFVAYSVHDVEIFLLGEQVELLGVGLTGVEHDVALVVDHRVELLGRKAQKVADFVR